MPEHRTDSPLTLLSVFVLLIVLTLLTVTLSFLALGQWHTAAGLAIATPKAILVAVFFLELRKSAWMYWLAVGAALFWLATLHVVTLADYWALFRASY